MSSVTVGERPTAAYAVSLIGGVLGLIAGVALFFLFWASLQYASLFGYLGGMYGGGFFSSYYNLTMTISLGFSVWMMLASIIVIVAAAKLNSNPMGHSTYGAVILVFGILGGALFIFGLIGGILALVYEPRPLRQGPEAPSREFVAREGRVPESVARFCPECGERVEPGMMFCPKCGARIR